MLGRPATLQCVLCVVEPGRARQGLAGPVGGRACKTTAGFPLWPREMARFAHQSCCVWAGFKIEPCSPPAYLDDIDTKYYCTKHQYVKAIFSRWMSGVQSVGPAQLAVPRTSVPQVAGRGRIEWMTSPKGRWHPAKSHGFRLSSLCCGHKRWARHAFNPSQHSQHSAGETMARWLPSGSFGCDTAVAWFWSWRARCPVWQL